ncbi:uncharacterized protein LOC133370417 isoform X2 [Rhineura floridana]|uniref:uncharacterized protein LOC133370417 isoform X2 n=1 Tax=Rhineura floridana TaxID=261503 RepID=UPI002AC876E7|nr:uncharacterized protein LOC133370417 isoform X2 [Rhineura floridana]
MTIKKIMDVQEGTLSLDMFQKIMNGINSIKQELRNNRQAWRIEFHEMRQELKETQDSMRKENKDRSGKQKKDGREIKGKVQTMEIGLIMDMKKDLDFLAVMDPGDKYYSLEFSAVLEGIEEIGDKDIISSRKFLDWKDLMELEMEKVNRINPCFVSMEKPSRDVLVYHVEKRNRDAALQQHFSDTFGFDGGTLRCETCTGETACTGEERNCSEGQNACGSTLTEGPKGDTTFSSLVKGCLSSDLCKIPVEVRLGEDKYLRQTTICCWRDACASEPPDLPRTSQKINGKFCPACASSTDVCPEEYVYCTGDHAYCLGFVTVTAAWLPLGINKFHLHTKTWTGHCPRIKDIDFVRKLPDSIFGISKNKCCK